MVKVCLVPPFMDQSSSLRSLKCSLSLICSMHMCMHECACMCIYFLCMYNLLQSSTLGELCLSGFHSGLPGKCSFWENRKSRKASILLSALLQFPLQFLGFCSLVKLGKFPSVYFFVSPPHNWELPKGRNCVSIIEFSGSKIESGM